MFKLGDEHTLLSVDITLLISEFLVSVLFVVVAQLAGEELGMHVGRLVCYSHSCPVCLSLWVWELMEDLEAGCRRWKQR